MGFILGPQLSGKKRGGTTKHRLLGLLGMKGKLPKSWADVTVPQLIQIDEVKNDKSIDEDLYPNITRNLLILSIFTGIPYEEYESMPMSEWKKDLAQIDFINEMPQDKIVQDFSCGGYYWKVNHKVSELSAKQMVEHYELTKDPTKILFNANKIMALYCEPYKWGRKIKLSDEQIQNALVKCPINVLYPLTFFFAKAYPHYLKVTTDYLKKAEIEIQEMLKEQSLEVKD